MLSENLKTTEATNYNPKRNFMKYTIILIGLCYLTSCAESGNIDDSDNGTEDASTIELTEPANETLDELGASIILFLKDNNFENFTGFLPVSEDVERIAMKYKGPEEKKKELLLKMDENVKDIMIYSKTGFDEVFNNALKANVVWSNVKFSHVEYDISKKDNLESASMTIFFIHNNLNYKIYVGECVHSERGWLVTDKPQWDNID